MKTCTIRKDADQWYACFTVEVPDADRVNEKKEITNAVGADVGVKHMATLSNGTKVENPKWLKESEKKLAKEQRRLSRKKKASKNRDKQRRKVAKMHRKIRNQRNDFFHKLSRWLANNYDLIVFEKLNIKNMLRNHHLAKSISDASWYRLINSTRAKAEEAGCIVELVNPRGTSQEDSGYGIEDRDWNAAINILKRGLEEYTSGTGGRACLSCLDGEAMMQEATYFNRW